MKKIILFLALLSLGVSKAQVVGGYLPLNSTKSATMGGLRVNGAITGTGVVTGGSLTTAGTLSVGSTATINGSLKGNSSIDGASYKMNGTAIIEASNSRVLLSGGSYTAVEISGSEPLIMNSAVLTGGNTGTVAVLSDALFAYNFQVASAVNPNDATSYYFSNLNYPTWLSSAGANSILMPYNATLIGYHINYVVNGVTGTAETATLQISASGSATNLVTNIDFTGASDSYTSNALSLPVVAGSLISAVLITPTWATNPTNIRMGITFLFVRRS